MKKIDDLLLWYKENSLTPHDYIASVELEKINSLYDKYKDLTNKMFVEEMIESFCKIIAKQQEKAAELEESLRNEICANSYNSEVLNENPSFGHNFMTLQGLNPNSEEIIKDFSDDKQLQDAFTKYWVNNKEKKTSSYTVNDYCSRVKNTWNTFEKEHTAGTLKGRLAEKFPEVPYDGVLINVFNNIELLREYIESKIEETEGNRNWLNARAALNKFDKFKASINNIFEVSP